jgi:hypothetical protein
MSEASALGNFNPLDQQHDEKILLRIDPTLRAEGASVAERAAGKHRGDALRLGDHGPAVAERAAGREPRRQRAGVRRGHRQHALGRKDPLALEAAAAEHHAVQTRQVAGGGIQTSGGNWILRAGR